MRDNKHETSASDTHFLLVPIQFKPTQIKFAWKNKLEHIATHSPMTKYSMLSIRRYTLNLTLIISVEDFLINKQ